MRGLFPRIETPHPPSLRYGTFSHKGRRKKQKGPGVSARTLVVALVPLSPLLAGDLVVDAFDIEVHAEHLAIVEMGAALAFDFLAVLADDRAFEREQLAVGDGGFGVHGEL